ncbi:phosphotransferase [Halotia branconii]|uniref:Phosphotransferase n=1 Tax=Halotia branconii CENA392 TaxID=1539056 RepID=A0AAJ6P9G6_9CYAN|nr:phosphotransferase [Halotia branconii]WGV25725.1 phosphotransferase [Halotia branconii CENA392]
MTSAWDYFSAIAFDETAIKRVIIILLFNFFDYLGTISCVLYSVMQKPQNLQLSMQDVVEVLREWSFLGNLTVKPTNQGTVNTTFFVETQAGNFVLKLYNDTITNAQIQYEHSLLAHLKSCNLSFALPTPIPNLLGETLILVNQNHSLLRVALLPFISGQPAERKNLAHTYAVGQVLGELHHALAKFDLEAEMAQLPAWGDLEHIHPLVTDPLVALQSLKLPLKEQEYITKFLTKVIEAAPNLYKTLPVQTTHADYLSPNVLLIANRVVGVLDFEFATSDLRLMDYVAALDHFTRFSWQETPHWEFVQTFSAGYSKHISLIPAEVEALALVWRLQRASCIIYWTGWFLEGKATRQSVVDAVINTILLEEWFEENTTKMAAIFTN